MRTHWLVLVPLAAAACGGGQTQVVSAETEVTSAQMPAGSEKPAPSSHEAAVGEELSQAADARAASEDADRAIATEEDAALDAHAETVDPSTNVKVERESAVVSEGSTPVTASEPSDAEQACAVSAAEFESGMRQHFNKCYREGKRTMNANLTGAIGVQIVIDGVGRVSRIERAKSTSLPASVTSCMLEAVKSHKAELKSGDCPGKTLVVGKTFGQPAK